MNNYEPAAARFLTLKQAAEELSSSIGVLRTMVRSGELPAIQIGGRGQWRIERTVFEEFIQHAYGRSPADVGAPMKREP